MLARAIPRGRSSPRLRACRHRLVRFADTAPARPSRPRTQTLAARLAVSLFTLASVTKRRGVAWRVGARRTRAASIRCRSPLARMRAFSTARARSSLLSLSHWTGLRTCVGGPHNIACTCPMEDMLLPQPRLPLPHGCLGMPAAGSVAPRTATRIPHGVVSPAASSQHPPHPARPRTNGKYTPRCAPQRKRHTPHPSPHPTPITREWNHMQNESHSTHNTARHTAAAHGSTHDHTRDGGHQAVFRPTKAHEERRNAQEGQWEGGSHRRAGRAHTRAWWLLLHMR